MVILLDINTLNGNACAGEDLQIVVTPSGGTPSYTFTWTGIYNFFLPMEFQIRILILHIPGNYQVIIHVADINGNLSADTCQCHCSSQSLGSNLST